MAKPARRQQQKKARRRIEDNAEHGRAKALSAIAAAIDAQDDEASVHKVTRHRLGTKDAHKKYRPRGASAESAVPAPGQWCRVESADEVCEADAPTVEVPAASVRQPPGQWDQASPPPSPRRGNHARAQAPIYIDLPDPLRPR